MIYFVKPVKIKNSIQPEKEQFFLSENDKHKLS